jgi:predicted component of type VI protein secretion system
MLNRLAAAHEEWPQVREEVLLSVVAEALNKLLATRRAANDIRCALKNGIQSLDSSVVDFAWICFEDFERPQIRSLSAQTGFLKS